MVSEPRLSGLPSSWYRASLLRVGPAQGLRLHLLPWPLAYPQ